MTAAVLDSLIWKRSAKGNLWCKIDGLLVTVFAHPDDGGFKWCIADEDGPAFSPKSYKSEEKALRGVERALQENWLI